MGMIVDPLGLLMGLGAAKPQAQPPQSIGAFMAVPNPRGLVQPGNIHIWSRPTIKNADGSVSTEYSTSFTDDQGREVLLPTVVNGKFLTPDGSKPPEGSKAEKAMFRQAWKHYQDTGEHLGIFDTSGNASAYANLLHNRSTAITPSAAASIRTRLTGK